MVMEELDEFEVLWPETCHANEHPPPPTPTPGSTSPVPMPVRAAQPPDAPAAASARSRPVDVPGRHKAARSWRWTGHALRDDSSAGDPNDDNGGGSAIVPPHLLLSAGWRRSEADAEPAAWTLRASVGLPFKRPRDLRHLRDSVLRMTGFIEE